MPTYDFSCTSCGAVFEAYRGFAQGTDGVVCPDDGADAVRVFAPSTNFLLPSRRTERSGPPAQAGRPTQGGRAFGHGHSHGPGTAPHSH